MANPNKNVMEVPHFYQEHHAHFLVPEQPLDLAFGFKQEPPPMFPQMSQYTELPFSDGSDSGSHGLFPPVDIPPELMDNLVFGMGPKPQLECVEGFGEMGFFNMMAGCNGSCGGSCGGNCASCREYPASAPAAMPMMTQAMTPGMTPGMAPGINPGLNPRMAPGMAPPINQTQVPMPSVPVNRNFPNRRDSRPRLVVLMRSPAPGHHRFVRGIAADQVNTRMPKTPPRPGHHYVPVTLCLNSAQVLHVCHLPWLTEELRDRRRIVRVERRQKLSHVYADFLIVGLANEHPEPAPAPAGVDVFEVSCLEFKHPKHGATYYITLVEVVGIVELLIGTMEEELAVRRKERGRIRLNLLPFWLQKLVPSKKHAELALRPESELRAEFARQIMAYEVRMPRGFDKSVRILWWDKLVPALQRALQCYYAEVPNLEFL